MLRGIVICKLAMVWVRGVSFAAVAGSAVGSLNRHAACYKSTFHCLLALKADKTLWSSTANEIASWMLEVGKVPNLGVTVGQPANPTLQNGVDSVEK